MNYRTAALALGLAILLQMGCKREMPKPPPPPPAEVAVATPIVRDVTEYEEFTGRLESSHPVEVRARVGGQILSDDFTEGGLVKEGDLLFLIDERPYQIALQTAEATVAQAESRLDLAKADLKRGEKALAGGALGPEEVDGRRAAVRDAEARIRAAEAQREEAKLNLSWCRVTAPISGRISRKLATKGNMITGSSNMSTGTLLTNIVALDPIYCYVDADERLVLKYQNHAKEKKFTSAREGRLPCWLKLSDQEGYKYEGYVDFVDNRINPTTGTQRARGLFANADGFLVPGFFAYMRVPGLVLKDAVLVLDEAIATDQNRKYVLVVDEKDIVHYRPVVLGPREGHMRVITSGLAKTDRIIINGAMRARPGAPVKPTLMPMPTEPRPSVAITGMNAPRPATAPASAPASQPGGGAR